MDEYVIKQKIQDAYSEPRAPESLIEKVILRSQAVTMGVNAQQQLETAPAENVSRLASQVLIGRLAEVSELPKGTEPEKLAKQLEQEPAFQAALRGGNVTRRLDSGELLRQITEQQPEATQKDPEISVPIKEAPELSAPIKGGPVMG